MRNSSVVGFSRWWNGGGIDASLSSVQIYNSYIANCSSRRGGGVYISSENGMQLHLLFLGTNLDLIISNTTFVGNEASREGGAIYYDRHPIRQPIPNTFIENSAPYG